MFSIVILSGTICLRDKSPRNAGSKRNLWKHIESPMVPGNDSICKYTEDVIQSEEDMDFILSGQSPKVRPLIANETALRLDYTGI